MIDVIEKKILDSEFGPQVWVFLRASRIDGSGNVTYHRTSFLLSEHSRAVTEVDAHLARLGWDAVDAAEKIRVETELSR